MHVALSFKTSGTFRQTNKMLLKLGLHHRIIGIPSDYFGVMGPMFIHTIRPCLEKRQMWDEETDEAWHWLFSHITRVMVHGHKHASAKSPSIDQ